MDLLFIIHMLGKKYLLYIQISILFQPAGSMEDFFEQMSKTSSNIPKDQEQIFKNLWETHGMQVVGPPLKF